MKIKQETMQRHKDTEPLMKNRLFTGIDSSKFKMKLRQNNFLSYREGDIIFQKGDAGENIYLILEGEIKLKIHSSENGANIFRKGKNDFFGEKELFEKASRYSSAIANSDCILYTLSRKELYELISANKIIKKNINGENLDSSEPGTESSEPLEDAFVEESGITEELEESNFADESEEPSESFLSDAELIKNSEDILTAGISNPDSEEQIELTNADFKEDGITLTTLPEDQPESDIIWQSFDEESTQTFCENPDESIFSSEHDLNDKLNEENPPEVNEFELDNIIREDNNEESLFVEPKFEMPEEAKPEAEDIIDYKKIYQAVKKIYSDKELEQTVRSTIEALIDLFDAQIIRIFIADKNAGELWAYPFMDNSEEIKKIKLGEGLIGGSAVTREVINLNEPMSDARFNPLIDSIENILIEDMILFPVLNENQELTAVIQMINSGKNGFTSADIEMLSILSPDISNAVERAKPGPKPEVDLKEHSSSVEAKTIEEEYTYFSKASEFLTSGIKTSSSLLLRYLGFIKKKSESDEIKNASNLALQQAEIILKNAGVVSDFIDGKSALKKETTGIRNTIDEILDMLAEYAEARKAKLFKKCLTEVPVNMDKQAFYIACYQIVKNSCDAMPQGGNIYVTCNKEENNLLVEINDTGKGISKDIKEKIFEPFFSFPAGKPGLGLSVASKIIKDHGGELKFNPDVTEGASFIITIPVVE